MKVVALVVFAACATTPTAMPTTATTATAVATDPDRGTVPLDIDHHRPFIDIDLKMPSGATKTARFLVDSGGGSFILTEPLAHALGVTWGDVEEEEGEQLALASSPPSASVGGFPLDLSATHVVVSIGAKSVLPPVGGHAEGMLPGGVRSKYAVVFDYPARQFTIAKPGALAPVGQALPMPVGEMKGFPTTELTVDGQTRAMLLDTGASFTMVSQALLKTWKAAHPDWEVHDGAFGDAATLGGRTLETMFVPAATWAGQPLDHVGVTSQREGVFEKFMSSMTAVPIVGSLAGNVLDHYRIELDYVHQKLYVSKP